MSQSTRMFEIIQMLRSRTKPLTAQDICDELEVSKRTIYRDITTLQSIRVPIDGAAGVGYIMRPGYNLPPLSFSSDEIEAISVGLALLRRTTDTGLQRAANQVAQKIHEVLPSELKSSFKAEVLHVSGWNEIPNSKIALSELRRAIRDEIHLELDYVNATENCSRRTILPLAIIYYIDAVVLAAWCELRHDFRHFRVDRITGLKITGENFSGEGDNLREKWRESYNLP